jgi:hypothetical protein
MTVFSRFRISACGGFRNDEVDGGARNLSFETTYFALKDTEGGSYPARTVFGLAVPHETVFV